MTRQNPGPSLGFVLGTLSDFQPTGDEPVVSAFVVDSREAIPGSAFIAFRGERVDGHDYVSEAFSQGAIVALIDRHVSGSDWPVVDVRKSPVSMPRQLPFAILVDDTMSAIQRLAGAWRARFDTRLIGITGSVGKTSTKEMIASVLSRQYRTLKSEGNQNNEIGVPLTLLKLRSDHQRAIAAYTTALTLEPEHPVTLYNIGACAARNGEVDKAFEWLTKARATRKYVMTQLTIDPDMASIRSHAQFATLLPAREDFADPFVEKTTIVREWKSAGTVKYIGITHYSRGSFDELEQIVKTENLDFVQLPYNVADRGAEKRLIPAARDAGAAVLVMEPFASGALFGKVKGKALPAVATELGCTSWGQLFLKFLLDRGASTAPGALRQAVESLGTSYESAWTFGTRFGPGRHDGATAGRVLVYEDGCECFRYEGADIPIP